MKTNSEILCCNPLVPCSSCPNLIHNKDHFIIEDDYEDSIKIDIKDIESVVEDVDRILSLPRTSLDS